VHDKKEIKIFLIYKEIQSGVVAKSYMRKGFPIYEEMRKYFPIYEEAVSNICSILNFRIYEENLIFLCRSRVSHSRIIIYNPPRPPTATVPIKKGNSTMRGSVQELLPARPLLFDIQGGFMILPV
jgi:hypothetical protein